MRIVSQLSVFLKNTRGALEYITHAMTQAGVNISGISTHEAFEYGVIRIIVSDPDTAEEALKNVGVPGVIRNDVLEVELEDSPGAMNQMLRKLADNGISVGYIYGSSGKGKQLSYVSCDDLDKAMVTLA